MEIILKVNCDTGEVTKLGEIIEGDETSSLITYGILKFDDFIDIISKACNINRALLFNKTKQQPVIFIRQISWYILYETYKITNFRRLGRLFNDFSHATVMHGIKIVKREMFSHPINKNYVDYYDIIMDVLKKKDALDKTIII